MCTVALLVMEPDLRAVLAPLFSAGLVSAMFLRTLMLHDRQLPVFELGAFFMISTTAYAALPLVGYALSGLQLSPLSHGRLYGLDPTPDDFAYVGWIYVMFMVAFAAGYLAVRTRSPTTSQAIKHLSQPLLVVVIAMWIILKLVFLSLNSLSGISFSQAYGDATYATAAAYLQVPLLGRQVIHHLYGILIILNIAMVIIFLSRWKSRIWRVLLIAWLCVWLADYLINPGGRFALFSMLIAFGMGYHRLVRPLRFYDAALGVLLLFAAFMMAGFMRGAGDLIAAGLYRVDVLDEWRFVFTVSDEFQNAYGSLLELKYYYEQGLLDPVPWQIYLSDILLPIPQQILPFSKIDPVEWYVGVTQNPDYFGFSTLSQSVLGLGTPELILRAALIGVVLGTVHNWWARAPGNLWRNVLYVWLAVMSYHLIRNTSLYLVPIVIYRFIPLLIMVAVGEWLLRGTARAQTSPRSHGPSLS